MKKTLASVVIPTYNEEKDVQACIDSLKKQSYKPLEIIFVDDGSTDKTREIIKKNKGVKLVEGEHKGPGFSRNLGAKKAKGTVLFFVDADMVLGKDYVKDLITPILKGETMGTEERTQITLNPENMWSRCWGSYVRSYPKKKKEGNVFRAILKKKFFEMGCFDPGYGYADDMTFYFKHGVKSKLVDQAECYHKNAENLRGIYKQSGWIGASVDSFWVRKSAIGHLFPFLMAVASPVAIPVLAIRKSLKKDSLRLLIPWMIIFMSVRYFGTISGLIRKRYFGRNVR